MSIALQIVLFAAALAVLLSVIITVPITILAWRRLERLAQIVEELRTDMQVVAHDGRELMWTIGELSKRVSRQMDDVEEIVCTAKLWTQRADRLVDEVGSIVEPPVAALAQGAGLARVGIRAFFKALLHGGSGGKH